jgi:hypothetical protein
MSREAEVMLAAAMGHQGATLTYRTTASKWAGPISGRVQGYGTYPLRSTTRNVRPLQDTGGALGGGGGGAFTSGAMTGSSLGPLPLDQVGGWGPATVDLSAPLPAWEAKAARLQHAYDLPPRPSPYPTFETGQRVRALARDQPNVWFDATVVAAKSGPGGDPALAAYDVRYDGYASQPSRAIGRDLPVSCLQSASALMRLDR